MDVIGGTWKALPEAIWVRRVLEEGDEFQRKVGDGAQPKDDGPHSHWKAAMTLKSQKGNGLQTCDNNGNTFYQNSENIISLHFINKSLPRHGIPYLVIFDYLGGPFVPPDAQVNDHVDEEQVGDEEEVEEEPVRLGELVMGHPHKTSKQNEEGR